MAFSYGWESQAYSGYTEAAELLINFYLPEIKLQHDTSNELINRLEKKLAKKYVSGSQVVIPLELGFDPGGAANLEGLALAHPGNVQRDTSEVTLKEISFSIALTARIMALAKDKRGAFVEILSRKIKGVAASFKHMTDRMIWGDGSGFLHTISAASTTASGGTITVANTSDLRHCFEGMYVDVIDASTPTQINNGSSYHAVMTAIDRNAKTYVLTAATGGSYESGGMAASDCVLSGGPLSTRKYATNGTDNTYYEIMGLAGIVSASDPGTGDLQGLDRTTYPWWKAEVNTNSSVNRTFTEKLLLKACNQSFNNGGNPTAMYMDRATYAAFADGLVGDKRHVGTTKLKSGMEVPTFDAAGSIIPLIATRQCDPHKVYIIDEKTLHFQQAGPVDWIPGTQDKVMHWDQGYSRFIASLIWFANLATVRPSSNVLLSDLST